MIMTFALLAGCGGNDTPAVSATPATATPSADPTTTPSGQEELDEPPLGYPIGEYELEFWLPMFAEMMAHFSDWNETEVRQEAEKRTGIHINWITPNSNNSTEIFQVMIAGGDYPDLISYSDYIGGGDGAIDDGVYLRLNELIDEYAPNYTALLDSNITYYKDTRTDKGNMWAMHILYALDCRASGGIVWRQDLAAKIGWSETPKTITEFDEFLYDALDAGYTGFFSPPQYGFITFIRGGLFPQSFGASTIFLNVDGKATYGPTMEGFKDYIIKMKEWYDAGIIDPDFMGKAWYETWSDIATGKYLVGVGVNGIMGDIYAQNGVSNDPNCYIAAIAPLAEADGTPAKSGNYMSFIGNATAVSTDCENPEIAVRWLDYWYSDEGVLLANYGIEGYSFEYDENGDP